jgi:Holliday junction DNA helicase RuvA
MYAYIKGKLEYKGNDYIIIEAGGIGYRINTALSTLEAIGPAGGEARVYTHLYVREDIMCLYGFSSQEELGMFELLISVSGVGPKAAISVLSSIAPSKFGLAVITDDTRTLTRAQGIGNKMAQRIILELKDKMKKEQLLQVNSGLKDIKNGQSDQSSAVSEAVSALMVLGYSIPDANRAVLAVYSENMELEAIIKSALKQLAR